MIGYADFFTMGAIALTRAVNIVCSQARLVKLRILFSSRMTSMCCLLIWVLTFLILSPTTFGVEGFGAFGYDPQHGKCEIKGQEETGISQTGWYFLSMNTVSCIITVGSYIILSFYINNQAKRLASSLGENNVSMVNHNIFTHLFLISLLRYSLGTPT